MMENLKANCHFERSQFTTLSWQLGADIFNFTLWVQVIKSVERRFSLEHLSILSDLDTSMHLAIQELMACWRVVNAKGMHARSESLANFWPPPFENFSPIFKFGLNWCLYFRYLITHKLMCSSGPGKPGGSFATLNFSFLIQVFICVMWFHDVDYLNVKYSWMCRYLRNW